MSGGRSATPDAGFEDGCTATGGMNVTRHFNCARETLVVVARTLGCNESVAFHSSNGLQRGATASQQIDRGGAHCAPDHAIHKAYYSVSTMGTYEQGDAPYRTGSLRDDLRRAPARRRSELLLGRAESACYLGQGAPASEGRKVLLGTAVYKICYHEGRLSDQDARMEGIK